MTLTFAYENATRPLRHGPYTPEEDAALVALGAAGASYAQIAAALGRTSPSVKAHIKVLGIVKIPAAAGPGATYTVSAAGHVGITNCIRCGLRLSCAPAGRGGQCGWCVREGTP